MLAAGAPDLDLVDVVEQGRGLDQRAVDRDPRLGQEGGGGDGDASDALGVANDAVGQFGVGEQAAGGGAIGNGHVPMLAVASMPCTARAVLQPASVRTA